MEIHLALSLRRDLNADSLFSSGASRFLYLAALFVGTQTNSSVNLCQVSLRLTVSVPLRHKNQD